MFGLNIYFYSKQEKQQQEKTESPDIVTPTLKQSALVLLFTYLTS